MIKAIRSFLSMALPCLWGSFEYLKWISVFEKELFTYTALLPVFAYAFLLFLMINVIDNALYGILIRRYSITFLTFASFLTPLFGVIYGIMFMGEHISWTHVFAFGFIFLGLYLFYRDELKTRRQSPPPGPEQISL